MILLYVDNQHFGEVSGIAEKLGNVRYRNPKYFDKPEKCDKVYIYGDWPKVSEAYGDKVISDYPIKRGAGWYELSNGETVRGEQEAIEAEALL